MSPTPRRRRTAAALLAGACCLTACTTVVAAPRAVDRTTAVVATDANTVLSALRSEALRQGGLVTSESATSFTVDYGVQVRRVQVPTDDGPWGSRTESRETEVHTTVTYSARDSRDGAVVSLAAEPIYWHPDRRIWLPAPREPVPGREVLRGLASGPR